MAFVHVAARHSTAKSQKAVVDLLRDRHAFQRETAQPLPDLSTSQRRRIERLVDRDIVRRVPGNRYYLDEEALRDWHSRLRAIGFAVWVVAAGAGAAWFLTA